ncbi:sugar-binding transcriptional regulator [Clostridium grantii]|uniref:Central glycolytic genes regulator n=1 Tax=Clostridium grantii DSM 8605 TaxID=1121316 RepID=A0A1M5RRE5_9CLOT|nr:sugar-binding domain-containing protein [Clostridium grantii]SHH28857.1 central glycolytic genes regulator [Clostridium grantii DSM 8605]
MYEILSLQQKIMPELLEVLQKRYSILRTIYYNAPVGRRMLSNLLGMSERIVRTEINFLKKQNLIDITSEGMKVTEEGEEVVDKLKELIHDLRGLHEIEEFLEKNLNVKKVFIVPGNADDNEIVLNEIGKTAASYIKERLKDNNIIALTGGSSVKKIIDNIPHIRSKNDIMVVPARGGIGGNVDVQSNTIAAKLANKLDARYKMLHVPDNLSDSALKTIQKEKSIMEVLDLINNADILIYGIGRATKMAEKRGLGKEIVEKLEQLGAVGEAFGCYFNIEGEIIFSTPTIGIKNEQMTNVETSIAIAGGKRKAKAIIATEMYSKNSILFTDEGAAMEIMKILSERETSN